jgi:Ca-activated chloride channel family protein
MDCGDRFGVEAGLGWSDISGDPFGGGFRRGIDEETLNQVAALTGGTYYSAVSASELQDVFQNLPIHLITRQETMEVSVAFTAIGALLAALAIGLSLIWRPLP